MADEEKIDSYVDRPAVADDTKFLTDQLKAVLDLFDKVNAKKITLNVATTLKETTEAAKETQKAVDNLTTGKQKLLTVDLQSASNAKQVIAAQVQQASGVQILNSAYDKLVKQLIANDHALSEISTKMADLKISFHEGIITVEHYKERMEELKKEQISLKTANQDVTRAIKNFNKEAQSSEGSLNNLRAQLNQTLQAYDSLSEVDKKSELGTSIKKDIDSLTESIKKQEEATGRFQRNVGNYPASAKIIVDALSGLEKKIGDLQAKQQGLVDFSKRNPIGFRTSGGQNDLDQTSAQLKNLTTQAQSLSAITSNPQFLNITGKVGDTNAELKFFTKQLNQLEDAGLKNEKVYKDVQKRLAELTDQLGDTRAEIKAMASDTRSFDLFAGAVNFAADTFQTFAGVMALGTENEKEAQETLKTLVAIQTISNGVKGIANELTTKGTAANKLYAFSQKQITTAMDSTVASSARVKAALITIGFGALIIGIGLLIANFDKLKNALSGISKQQQLLNEVNSKAIDGYVKEKIAVQQLAAEGLRETTSKRRKLEIIKELNEKSPVYFGHIKTEKDLQNGATEAVNKYVQAIIIKAKAQAAVEILAEKEKAVVLRQIELERQLEAAKTQTFDSEERKQRHIKGLQDLINKGADTTLIALEKQADPIRKVIEKLQQDLDNLGGDPNPKQTDAIIKTIEEEDRRILQKDAERLKTLAQNEDAHLITRINAKKAASAIEKQILLEQTNVALKNIDSEISAENSKADKNLAKLDELNTKRQSVIKKSHISEQLLEQEKEEAISQIRATSEAKRREQEQQYNEQFFTDQEDRLNKEVENIQNEQQRRLNESAKGQEAELNSLNKWYEKRVAGTREGSKARNKVEEKYAQDRAEIEYRYAVATVKNEIDTAEKILAVHKAAGIDVTEEEKRIHDLKIQLSDAETKHVIDNEKKKKNTRQETLEALEAGLTKALEIEGQVADVIGGFISASVDKQKNAIQDQIDAIDEKSEKEIEAVNASALSEEEKADKIAVINAKADAQEEALERKQRQLDLKRARYEKAANIARISLETALAVVHQLASGDPYTAIPRAIAAGALGAAQLAVAIATPLPEFKYGREDGPATFGIVGDGGKQEVIYSPDLKHAVVTPDTDTLTFIPQGYGVSPSIEDFQAMALNMVHKPLQTMPIINNNNDGLIHAMAYSIGRLERAVLNKQETHFHWSNGELQKSIKNGQDWWRYIQNNI